MRILLIHQAFAALDEAGGTRHYEMARNLAAQGHEMVIITSPVSYLSGKTRTAHMRWVETETPEAGITILRSYAYAALHRSFVHRVFSFFSFMFSSFFVGLGVKNVDLVWGTSPPIFQGWTAWLLARLKGVPFLFEVRDLWPAFAIAVGVLRSKLLIRLSEWLEGFLYRHADCVVVNSPGYVKHVRGRGSQRVELIPNGADPAMFDPQADGLPFRRRHGLEGRFVVLYAGAHGMSNDLGVVLDAAEILRDRPAVRFVLVGDGKEKAGLQAEAQRRGLDNVTFVASVSKNEMAGVLAAADACLAILKPLEMYKTTYPNKVFDYMAAGKAVVLAIDGVIREVVESAGAGLAVRPGDAQSLADGVLRMEADRDATRRMGENGRECIESRFDRAQFSAQFLDLLNGMRRERG